MMEILILEILQISWIFEYLEIYMFLFFVFISEIPPRRAHEEKDTVLSVKFELNAMSNSERENLKKRESASGFARDFSTTQLS